VTRIGEYRLRPYGKRGLELSIPVVWAADRGLKTGDVVDFYQDDEANLVIIPRTNDESHTA